MKMKRLLIREKKILSNEDILNLGYQVIKDFETLNELLFDLNDDFSFSSDKQSNLREMSQETDRKIRKLISKIENNINKINEAIRSSIQIGPLKKEEMDQIMVNIMAQYLFTSRGITTDSAAGENYSIELNEIHSALNNLTDAINVYNSEGAVPNNWPRIQSINNAFEIAKQQIEQQKLD
jgi:hypothetical protein